MKKLLLSLFAATATLFSATAAEVTFDFTTNQYDCTIADSNNGNYYEPDGKTISDGPITITLNKLTGSGCRFWKSGDNITFRVNKNSGITISISEGTITNLAITGSNFKNLSGEGYTDGKWTGSSNSIALKNTGSTVQIKTLTVTYEGGVVDTRKDAGLEFSATTATAILGQEFTAPTLSKETNANVVYSSDKEEVATVDAATGSVTIVGLGTARITATAEENAEFKAGSASYLLTVKEGAPANAIYYSELGEDFTFDNPEEIAVWSVDTRYGLKGSAFKNGVVAAVAVACSPVVDLTNAKSAVLNFKNALNQYKINNAMIPVEDFVGKKYAEILVREEGAADWTSLGEPTAPEAFSWNFYANAPIELGAYIGKKIQIGFRYMSTEEIAGTWEIQHIAIIGQIEAGVTDIVVDENAPVEFFNLQGVRVANPENGLYIRKQGNKVSKVIVK